LSVLLAAPDLNTWTGRCSTTPMDGGADLVLLQQSHLLLPTNLQGRARCKSAIAG
jgi:hypothetical protein